MCARDTNPVIGWSHTGWKGLGQKGKRTAGQLDTVRSVISRDSVSNYNAAIEIFNRHEQSLIEGQMTCYSLKYNSVSNFQEIRKRISMKSMLRVF